MSPEVQIHIYDYDDILPHLYNNHYHLHRAEKKKELSYVGGVMNEVNSDEYSHDLKLIKETKYELTIV